MTHPTVRRGLAATLGTVLLLGPLAACSGLPEDSPIVTGSPVGGVPADTIRLVPQGPAAGASAADVVRGFLRASVAYDDDPTVARQFLGPKAVDEWTPTEVLIHENDVVPQVAVSGSTATVTVPVTGSLDDEGHYRDLAPGSTARLTLPMAKIGGQWRIAGGLARFGALMTRADFARYGAFSVPYEGTTGGVAVEDRRWVLQGPGLLSRLARAVVAQAPAYLQGAVATGVPEYTELVGTVAVENGTASVQLSQRVADTDDATRRLLWSRFVAVLTQVREVSRVDLTSGGTRLSASGLPDRALGPDDVPLATARLRSDVLVLRVGTELTAAAPASIGADRSRAGEPDRPSGVTDLPRLPAGWYRVALAADAAEVAAVGGDDAELGRWRDGRRIVVPRFATALTRPAYDRVGTLWVAGRSGGATRLYALDTVAAGTRSVAPEPIDVPWLRDRQVRSVEVAADGQRLAVVSTDARGGGARVDVAGIVRRGNRPVGLASPRATAGVLVDVLDATWVDGTTLAVLGRRARDTRTHVVLVPLNDTAQVLREVPDARSITSISGERSIVVVTAGNRVLLRAGNTFTPVASSRDVAMPGR